MQVQEIVLCATRPSSSELGSGTIALHDLQTGTSLANFKHTNASEKCTATCPTKDDQGGFVLAAQADKSVMNVYNFQKDQLVLKIVLPEKLTCIALDRRGDFCAGGTDKGRIYLWEVASGILFNLWDAHYRKVTVLRFTSDGGALLSGSDDSSFTVWYMSSLLDDETQDALPTPYCILSEHTQPITDIVVGVGRFPSCRVLTASVDHSVKLWDLSASALLTTFEFPKPIVCLAFEIAERTFFAASSDGFIYQMNLFRRRATQAGRATVEAVGGGGAGDPIRFDEQEDQKRLINVGQPVTVMTLSIYTSQLLVGTTEGHIHIYDIASLQLLRSITAHKDYSITYLITMLKPPDLIGHMSLDFNISQQTRDYFPPRPILPFQRIRDTKSREAHEVTMLLPRSIEKIPEHLTSYPTDEFLRDYAFFAQSLSNDDNGASSASTLQAKMTELESEVTRLKEQLGKAKNINDVMWEKFVQNMVSEKKEAAAVHSAPNDGDFDTDVDMIAEPETTHKRQRQN